MSHRETQKKQSSGHAPCLPYRPYFHLRSGHLQTVLAGLSQGTLPPRNAHTLTVSLPDGDQLVVHEELGAALPDAAPLAILVHGLGGDHSSPYLQRVAHDLRQRAMRVWRVDQRGCGQGFELAWRPANAGASHDLAAVVATARQRYPQSPISIVGFSLSGNIVLKLLGELAAGRHELSLAEARIQRALAVAPPINLHHCSDNMLRWSRWLYTRYYLRHLEAQAHQKRQRWPQWSTLPLEPATKSILDFDARYTAPLSGFRDVNDYYEQSSSVQWLPQIQTPTEIILDRDDPIVTWKSHLDARFDPQYVCWTHTRYGGHMGYFGVDDRGRLLRWIEYYVVHRLSSDWSPSFAS
ncbi:MAG: alpha/beta fold hydrolase [Pirellulaceae bacterium]|nr:alpha/beta fold hydrolase [Pirellulaceae bacterium]